MPRVVGVPDGAGFFIGAGRQRTTAGRKGPLVFVDRVEIELVAGDGGNGCVSFRREKYVPKGGPDGGNGGNGGSIIVTADDKVKNLAHLAQRNRWVADKGTHGQGSDRHGRAAKDLRIGVPLGTLVLDAQHGFVIKDLTKHGETFIAARGGKGGRGNAQFMTSTNRAPRTATPGEKGEARKLIFELKAIADVGLVGMPNAGKSTMLSRLSNARPEIADYPFTTKIPNLGRVQLDIDRSFVMADIPGLIEGAHLGVGLGHEFLRHIERAGILVHLIEPFPMDQSDPIANYRAIRDELTRYREELGRRPEIAVVTKSELPGAEEVQKRLKEEAGVDSLLVSAVTGSNLNKLTGRIWDELQRQQAGTAADAS